MRRTSPGKWWWVYSSSSREISSRRIKYSRRISSSLRWRRSLRRQRCTARWRGYSSRNKTGRWWRAETSRWRAVGSSWSVWRKTKSHWGISFMKSRTVTEDWYPWNLWNAPPPHSIHIVKVAWTHSVWVTFDIFKDLMLQEGRFRWRFRWWWWWQWLWRGAWWWWEAGASSCGGQRSCFSKGQGPGGKGKTEG